MLGNTYSYENRIFTNKVNKALFGLGKERIEFRTLKVYTTKMKRETDN